MAKTIYKLIILFLGFFLVYISPISPNYTEYDILGNFLFWSSLLLLIIQNILKNVFTYLRNNLNKLSVSILAGYLSVHYFVYSIALEKLLTSVYGELFYVSSPFFSVSITPFYPPNLYTALINLIFNPAIIIGFPPNFYLELSFYSIILGFLIGSIVTSTIIRILDMSKKIRIKALILAPLFGVIAGGSCCISLPILLATVIPTANILFFLPIGNTALFLAYILLPPLTATGLAFHFNSLTPKVPKNFRLNILPNEKK